MNKDILHELFEYRDGNLILKTNSTYNAKIGDIAGSIGNHGYKQVRINGKDYLIHRLIFMYFNGKFPKYVDHIDNDRLNNRIENLRECSNQQNSFNSKIGKNNTSGIKGVSWSKNRNKWEAKIQVNRKTIHLGRFSDINEATKAVNYYRQHYHGEFARH